MFQESEVITLVLALIGLALLRELSARFHFPHANRFMAGYLFLLASYCFTVIEGFLWPQLCNFLEHACHLLAAVSFAAACLGWPSPAPTSPSSESPDGEP